LSGAARAVVLASSNPGKLAEIQAVLAPAGLTARPQSDFDVPPPAETGLTFVENALIKARQAAAATGLPALADDSGLSVDALDGAPGVRSARYAGAGAGDADNNAKLLAALADVPAGQRRARFHCVIVLLAHEADPTPVIGQGTWEGAVQTAPSGAGGFGYDPLFYVPAHRCSAAELDSETKNRISHRGQALAELQRRLATSPAGGATG